MQRLILALVMAAAAARAGVIQGVVLEHISGRPMTRVVVQLQPVPKSGAGEGKPFTTRSGRTGHFTFADVQPGIYLLTALNDGYFPSAYGQRLPTGHGTPIQVTAETNIFAELRLHHKGALTGRVLDENGVGTAGVSVLAYRARLPLRSAGSATSDDRGVYRIPGLTPGKYWVRSAAYTLSDGSGWLPTFGPQGREIRDARTHQVTIDADTTDADVSPEPGALFHLSGLIQCDVDATVTVTLSTETGRRSTRSACRMMYRFDGLAPAVYEVFATVPDNSAAGFTELFLDRDNDAGNVPVFQLPTVQIEMPRTVSKTAPPPIKLFGRRQDLSESEVEREITRLQPQLAPGNWEFRAQAPRGQYITDIVNIRNQPRRSWSPQRPPDWYEAFFPPRFPSWLRISVSDQAGQIHGKILMDGKPAPGVPVFLWPAAEAARRSLGGSVQTLSSIDGAFGFESLPPGDYRILASFDVNEIDAEFMEMYNAMSIHVGERQTTDVELPVWAAP